jgi:integrase
MMARDLTATAVRNAKALPSKTEPNGPPVRTEIPDGKSRGLFLVVQPSGAKSWALRFRFDGKPKKLTIGPVLDVREHPVDDLPLGEPHTLAEARIAADRARNRAATGDDPTARAVRADRLTLRQAVDRFIAEYAKPNNRSWAETERQLERHLLPDLGDRPIAELRDDEIRAPVDKLTADGKPSMANALHRTLSKFWKWCAAKERKIVAANPYAGFEMPNKVKSRDRVLSWDELATIWTEAEGIGAPFGSIVRVLILTGQRREEVAGMREAEIDRRQGVWTVPANRAKNGEPNPVPLTAPVLSEIDGLPRIGKDGLIFTTTGTTPFSGFGKAKARLDSKVDAAEPWRLHDLRRTFATGLESLGVPQEVTEALLNHTSGKKAGVAGIYSRHKYREERGHALTAWARFVQDVVAHDTARDTFMRLDDTRRVKEAIHGSDVGWKPCAAALQGGAEAWAEYLAELDRPVDEREAA